MAPAPHASAVGPELLNRYQWAFATTAALVAAADLDLFGHVAAGADEPAALARACGASERGVRILLDTLVGMGLLVRDGGRVRLAPGAERYLVEGAPEGRLAMVRRMRHLMEHFLHLTESVRSGEPVADVNAGPEFFRELVGGLFAANLAAARTAAAALAPHLPRFDAAALDVAAGSGVFGIALAEAHDGVRVTALDQPEVLEVTREFVERHGLVGRFRYLPADVRTVTFEEGAYDAVLLGHILHSEGEASTRGFLRRLFPAVRPGGHVVIAEFLLDDDRAGPLSSLLFGLNMLLHTREGGVFSSAEIAAWLQDVGFGEIRHLPADAPSPLLIATKP